jgi:hypothetical protein
MLPAATSYRAAGCLATTGEGNRKCDSSLTPPWASSGCGPGPRDNLANGRRLDEPSRVLVLEQLGDLGRLLSRTVQLEDALVPRLGPGVTRALPTAVGAGERAEALIAVRPFQERLPAGRAHGRPPRVGAEPALALAVLPRSPRRRRGERILAVLAPDPRPSLPERLAVAALAAEPPRAAAMPRGVEPSLLAAPLAGNDRRAAGGAEPARPVAEALAGALRPERLTAPLAWPLEQRATGPALAGDRAVPPCALRQAVRVDVVAPSAGRTSAAHLRLASAPHAGLRAVPLGQATLGAHAREDALATADLAHHRHRLGPLGRAVAVRRAVLAAAPPDLSLQHREAFAAAGAPPLLGSPLVLVRTAARAVPPLVRSKRLTARAEALLGRHGAILRQKCDSSLTLLKSLRTPRTLYWMTMTQFEKRGHRRSFGRRAQPAPIVSLAVFQILERCAHCGRRLVVVGGWSGRPRRVWCHDCWAVVDLLREPSA